MTSKSTIQLIRIFLFSLILICTLTGLAVAQAIDTVTASQQAERPGSVEHDLNNSLPKRESAIGLYKPDKYTSFKEKLYEKAHIKYNVSYQTIAMMASPVIRDPDYAAGGLFLTELEWTPVNPGKDYQGGIVFAVNHAHLYGDAAAPPFFFVNTGSMLGHDALYLDIGWFISNLYWEQWLKKDRFYFRIGQYVALNEIDFSRYADVRTSISNPAVGFPGQYIPFGPPALGITMKLLARKPTGGTYAVLHASDNNSEIDKLDWGNIFETGDVFIAGEIGRFKRSMGKHGGQLDHMHLLLFYATEASKRLFPTKSGWGFKLAGEKQLGKWVGIMSYAYNTASGGGFGLTNLNHVFNTGVAYTKPLGIKGEALLTYTWGKTQDQEGNCGAIPCNGDSQSMFEAYWKILLLPDMWVTPGLQVAINPVFNPASTVTWIPMIKSRIFF